VVMTVIVMSKPRFIMDDTNDMQHPPRHYEAITRIRWGPQTSANLSDVSWDVRR